MFYNQPEKYSIHTDEFEGRVRVSETYAEAHADDTYLNVSFGFRACRNGEWAIAAYAPDLSRSSVSEQAMWLGFEIQDDELLMEGDPRFKKWWARYILGNWEVEDGPIVTLDRVVAQVNSITECVANGALFAVANLRRLSFPSAENTHRYHDAHAEVYKLLIDGLDKGVIARLGDRLGIQVSPGDKSTLNALEKLFLSDDVRAAFRAPLDTISEQRRRASHKERPQAESFPAFESFGKDITAVIRGLEVVRDDLAERLNVDIERCEERASAIKHLPALDPARPTQPNYGIYSAVNLEGKEVVKVHTGEVMSEPEHPETEAILLEFKDGSMMSIEAATNISQLGLENGHIEPHDLHITFYVTYVPPMLPFRR